MKRLIALLLIVTLSVFSIPANAAVRNTGYVSTGGSLGASPKSFDFRCEPATDNLLLVTTYQAAVADTVTGVTYGGDALTFIEHQGSDAGINYYGQGVWALPNPQSGTHTVIITTSVGNVSGAASCYSGVRQVGSIDAKTEGTAAGTPLTFTVITASPKSWLYMVGSDGGGAAVATAPAILRASPVGTANGLLDSNRAFPTVGSNAIAMSWGGGGTAGGVAVALAPSGSEILRTQSGGITAGGIMGW